MCRDPRNPSTPKVSYTECHNDTITEIQFHPTQPDLVLSGSTDGLVNVLKISEPDEDEALYQVINHTSAVQHAGWLNDTDIYVLGTDETLSMYRLQNPDDDATELPPIDIGDVRDRLGCEYVVNVAWAGTEPVLAFGTYSTKQLNLFSFNGLAAGSGMSLSSPATRFSLPSAHGEEIVRDVYVDGGDNDVSNAYHWIYMFEGVSRMQCRRYPQNFEIDVSLLVAYCGGSNPSSTDAHLSKPSLIRLAMSVTNTATDKQTEPNSVHLR